MTMHEALARVPGLTRQELYRYEARGYIKPRKHNVGRVKRNDYSADQIEFSRLIKYYLMVGSSEGRTLDEANRMALVDMGKGMADVLRTY